MTPQKTPVPDPSPAPADAHEAPATPEGSDPAAGLGTDRLHAALTALSRIRAENTNLKIALHTNRDIAAATGILMAQLRLTQEQAFDRLRSTSQRSHRKVHDIACEVLFTGTLPEG